MSGSLGLDAIALTEPRLGYQINTCANRKSSSSILVMQSTQDWTAQNARRCLGGT
jgi:hypothetical protein